MDGRMDRPVDIVIIGLNSSRTLPACLESVKSCRYPQDLITVYYVDGGSSDESVRIAENGGARVIIVDSDSPTPGRQRNAGWEAGGAGLVQFLDSDTTLAPGWLGVATAALSGDIGAVCGNRRESHPERSVYNWIGDKEWNGGSGEVEVFGGDVLAARPALEVTRGYDPRLVAGEDPELAYRMRRAGYRILHLDVPMTGHDLALLTFRQYWRRAFRSGHAFAEVHALHGDFWKRETDRINLRGGGFLLGLLAAPLALLSPGFLVVPLLGIFALLRPRLLHTGKLRAELSLTKEESRIYAWHASVVVIPEFLGAMRFWFGRLASRPMTNRRRKAGPRRSVAG